jgi:hypothetical protein
MMKMRAEEVAQLLDQRLGSLVGHAFLPDIFSVQMQR